MLVARVHAVALNFNAHSSKGFDAFAVNDDETIFTLCDGANSCSDSGIAAQWLSSEMVKNVEDVNEQVFEAHKKMLVQFPETASTLLRAEIKNTELLLTSIGDSFLTVYRKSWQGFGGWSRLHKMPRDLDEFGHPSQLMGSEVCDRVNTATLPLSGLYCIAMMSDGPGLILSESYVVERLSVLGRRQPSIQDLGYLCESLAQYAQQLGCKDDTSIALVWIQSE